MLAGRITDPDINIRSRVVKLLVGMKNDSADVLTQMLADEVENYDGGEIDDDKWYLIRNILRVIKEVKAEEALPYLDSVWFDIKSAPHRYREVCRTKEDPWPRVQKSIELILNSDTEFWPRTTFVGGLIDSSDIIEILSVLKSIRFKGVYVIQNYVDSSGVRESESKSFSSPSLKEMDEFLVEVNNGIEIRLDWR